MNNTIPEAKQTVTARVIEGPAEFEMPLVHQAFVPFHNLWGINSCFLRGAFDFDIERLEAGCTSGSPVVASGQQMAGFLRFGPGRVCCPDRLINLDHGGGNIYLYGNPDLRVLPSEEDCIRHLRMFDLYDNVPRYPVLSVLPDHYSPAARQAVGDCLHRHTRTPRKTGA